MKILLVEDNVQRGLEIKRYLEKADLSVKIVDDGYAALREIEKTKPDIVFSDINLPYMDGFALARNMKIDDRFKNIKFILYSSLPIIESSISLARELGVDECLRYNEPSELTLEALSLMQST